MRSADVPRARAYVTSLAGTRVLPLLGHKSLAPSVTVPIRPWCGQILHFFIFFGGGKEVETNVRKREEGAIYLAKLVERNPLLDIMCKCLHKAAESITSEILLGIEP